MGCFRIVILWERKELSYFYKRGFLYFLVVFFKIFNNFFVFFLEIVIVMVIICFF